MSEFSVAGIRFRSGERTTTKLEVSHTIAGKIEIPLITVAGKNPGPKLCVVAGSHACEISSVEAAIRVTRMVKPEELNGLLISLPILNTPGLQTRSPYVCPLDGLNVNRVFPGTPDGSPSHRIAHKAFSIIKDSNYVIDLHGGDTPEEHINIVYVPNEGEPRALEASRGMRDRFLAEYSEVHGVAGSVSTEASRIGIPSLTVEGGELGRYDDKAIQWIVNGIMNVMKYLKMLPGESQSQSPEIFTERIWVRAPDTGILIRNVKAGEKVSRGQLLGRINNFYGDEVSKILSPTSGIVMMSFPWPAVNTGDGIWVICQP